VLDDDLFVRLSAGGCGQGQYSREPAGRHGGGRQQRLAHRRPVEGNGERAALQIAKVTLAGTAAPTRKGLRLATSDRVFTTTVVRRV